MSDYELVRPVNVSQLHETLTKLLKNRQHVDSIVVDVIREEIRVDLSRTANAFGISDFRLKLKTGRVGEARRIIDSLKGQDAPLLSQSQELFTLLDTAH